jgi:HlyD family secretion protein
VDKRVSRRLRVVLPAVGLALFLFGGWTLRNRLAADRQGEWTAVRRADLVTGFEISGTLVSIDPESLGPPRLPDVWNFKISMLAPEGSDVKKGQPVLGFDMTELQRRLESKSAEAEESRKQIEKETNDLALRTKDERLRLAEAEGRLRKATLKLEAPPDVAGVNEHKLAEIEHAMATREAAAVRSRLASLEKAAVARIRLLESRRREAESIVARTQDSMRQMTVLAPRDGTVVYVAEEWSGEKGKVGDTVWKGADVVEIPDLARMEAEGEIDEVDAGRAAVGQRVTLRLDAHPDVEFGGTIVSAGQTVQRKSGPQRQLKVLRVKIRLDRTDPVRMRPGMRYTGVVELGRVRNALLVPRSAVFLSSSGPSVIRRTSLGTEEVPLRLGRENAEFAEVLKGLRPGDRVLVSKVVSEEDES